MHTCDYPGRLTLLLLLKVSGHSSNNALQLLPEDVLAHFATQQPHDLCHKHDSPGCVWAFTGMSCCNDNSALCTAEASPRGLDAKSAGSSTDMRATNQGTGRQTSVEANTCADIHINKQADDRQANSHDRQTGRHAGRQTNRQTDRQAGRQAGRQADRQAGRQN